LAVAVEVPHCDRVAKRVDVVVLRVLEGAIAVAQQHADIVGEVIAAPKVCRGQVELTVAIEVGRDDANGTGDVVRTRPDEGRYTALFQDLEVEPMPHGSKRGPRPVLALAQARRQGGSDVLQPAVERHGEFSLLR